MSTEKPVAKGNEGPVEGETGAEERKEEKTGEDGKTQRDMQSVTAENDEQPALDICKIEKAH